MAIPWCNVRIAPIDGVSDANVPGTPTSNAPGGPTWGPVLKYQIVASARTTLNDSTQVEVEEWREAHGAQRCPGCFKIIEKDDPESCKDLCANQHRVDGV
jgi:hypothetical protein